MKFSKSPMQKEVPPLMMPPFNYMFEQHHHRELVTLMIFFQFFKEKGSRSNRGMRSICLFPFIQQSSDGGHSMSLWQYSVIPPLPVTEYWVPVCIFPVNCYAAPRENYHCIHLLLPEKTITAYICRSQRKLLLHTSSLAHKLRIATLLCSLLKTVNCLQLVAHCLSIILSFAGSLELMTKLCLNSYLNTIKQLMLNLHKVTVHVLLVFSLFNYA